MCGTGVTSNSNLMSSPKPWQENKYDVMKNQLQINVNFLMLIFFKWIYFNEVILRKKNDSMEICQWFFSKEAWRNIFCWETQI